MQRILIHINVKKSGEYDIFNTTNLSKLKVFINEKNNKECPNFGNKLWFQGLISVIQDENNIIDYYEYHMTKDYINSNYDLIIAPMANIFSIHFKDLLEPLAEKFEGIKIPVYVIACGVQADNYDNLKNICEVLREPATRFIKSIYNTGGEFALRGYFTKEFFDKLGFSTAVVTGCPSMYQMGSEFKVSKAVITENELKPLLNGRLSDYKKLYRNYPEAEFLDQHIFFKELYDEDYFHNREMHAILKELIKMYGTDIVEWLCKDRIKLFFDMNMWRAYICQNGFNFSFGNRIHGSIMPILSGVPAVLNACDSRTREMAEYFDIPYLIGEDYRKYNSLYDIYQWMDYSKFNMNFKQKFVDYENFLKKNGIVKQINCDNAFFYPIENVQINTVNKSKLQELGNILNIQSNYWKNYERFITIVRKIRRL